MKDLLQETNDTFTMAAELGRLLDEHKGGNTVIMDLRKENFWTDFFIITTVMSGVHLSGLERHIKEYAKEKGLGIKRSRKPDTEDEWCLIDMGNIIIHLMSEKSRSFYELERLWAFKP